jgi:hypothetical protein
MPFSPSVVRRYPVSDHAKDILALADDWMERGDPVDDGTANPREAVLYSCGASLRAMAERWQSEHREEPRGDGLREVWKQASDLAVKIINEARETGETDARGIRDTIVNEFRDAALAVQPPQQGEEK